MDSLIDGSVDQLQLYAECILSSIAWNNLQSNDLQHCSNTDAFKNKLKTFLFQRAFNNTD